MAVERAEQPGQGGVGGELVAGAAQEQGVGVAVAEPFDVLESDGALIGNVRRLAPNGDDEPEPVERPQPPEQGLGRGRVPAPRRLQIVEDRQSRRRLTGGGDFRFDFRGRARGWEAEIRREAAQQAVGVRQGLAIDEEPPALAETFDDAFIVGRRERQGRLAHAEGARHDDGPILIEDRPDEFV